MANSDFVIEKVSLYRNFFRARGGEYTAVFVANRFDGIKVDIDENGVSETAQYYNSGQMEEVIAAFDAIGVRFTHYASEGDFIRDALAGHFSDVTSTRYIVFPFAEGGSGSGRRALIPALCNLLGIPYCGSSAHACSIARHKYHANAVLRKAGVRVPDTWLYTGDGRWAGNLAPKVGMKVIVKPTYESNSIGLNKNSSFIVTNDLADRMQDYFRRIRQPAVVQEFVSGYEIAAPIIQIDGRTISLPCVGFETPRGRKMVGVNRTFRDECVDDAVSYYKVDQIERSYIDSFRLAAVSSFDALEMSIMGRMDSRIDDDGRAWIFDTNESPPPLSTTSYAASFELLGLSYVDMVCAWLGASCTKFQIM